MNDKIVILIGETDYICFVNMEGFTKLLTGDKLETILLDSKTKKETGKMVSLKEDRLISGDGDINMVPEDASYDKAEKVELLIGYNAGDMLAREKWCKARWAYGDIFVEVVDDLSQYR
ncbi:MAG: hypothetical protein ABIG37_02050 [Nanoarchaeota archaeon]|nr:hypothetical protein [Nanoarchaeota archaeon]